MNKKERKNCGFRSFFRIFFTDNQTLGDVVTTAKNSIERVFRPLRPDRTER